MAITELPKNAVIVIGHNQFIFTCNDSDSDSPVDAFDFTTLYHTAWLPNRRLEADEPHLKILRALLTSQVSRGEHRVCLALAMSRKSRFEYMRSVPTVT